MEEHLSIFEDIYDIKDSITDGQFLTLNNKLQKLIQENKDLRESLANHDLIVEQPQCSCSTRYVFPDIFNLIENHLSDFFCVQSYERLANCENFKRLMERFPHLENIFRRIDLPFAEEPIYQEYVKDEVVLISEILLFLVKNVSEKKDKAIITFVLYDFMIKNVNFMKDYQFYTKLLISKFEELLEDQEYIPIALEYNVSYTKWLDIMKNIVVSE
jgi:hypothetical protein